MFFERRGGSKTPADTQHLDVWFGGASLVVREWNGGRRWADDDAPPPAHYSRMMEPQFGCLYIEVLFVVSRCVGEKGGCWQIIVGQ